MSAETNPTTPLPSFPPAPDIRAAETTIVSMDPTLDALTQIRDQAASLGHNTLNGLTYEQAGIQYEVSDDVIHHTTETHKKMRRVLPSFSRQIDGAHTFVHKPKETEYITVKSFDEDGGLLSRVQYEASEFASYLNRYTKENTAGDSLITNLRLIEMESAPTVEDKTIDVDLNDEKKPVFDAVMETQEREGLPNWIGLTWARNGYPRRIIEDNSRSWSTQYGSRQTLREWVIETSNAEGQIANRVTLNAEQLRDYLQIMNTPPNPPLNNLRFVTLRTPSPEEIPPKDPLELWRWKEDRAWLGWLAAESPEDGEVVSSVGEDLSVDDAANMLSYGDLYGGGSETRQKATSEIKNSVENRKYIKALQAIVKEIGVEGLRDLAESMLTQYNTTLKKLGLTARLEDTSMSWPMEQLAKQRYLADRHKAVREAKDDGLEIHDPAGRDSKARLVRRNIVDIRVGQTYAAAALHREEVPTRKVQRVPEAERKPGENEYKETVRSQTIVRLDEAYTNSLQSFIRDEVVSILKKAETGRLVPKGQRLTSGDLARLGELLGRASGQRLLS